MEKPTVKEETFLQCILGVDKGNPSITVYRDLSEGKLHVYYGHELLGVVEDDRERVDFKILVGRLYNAGLKKGRLQRHFDVDPKTMKRWGEALQSGEAETLARVLAGRSAQRKLTREIRSFVRVRFGQIYGNSRYTYSKKIRGEIEEVFGVSHSGETLRPVFKELKEAWAKEAEGERAQNRETPWDCAEGSLWGAEQEEAEKGTGGEGDNRKESPDFARESSDSVQWCRHLGVLLFSEALREVAQLDGDKGWLLKQWLACGLLAAVNIEQSKLLDLEDLQKLIGRVLYTPHLQRQRLSALADEALLREILRLNARGLNASAEEAFYYDPHTKHYTGTSKLLAGWCPGIRLADKALHSDFIHTLKGYPVYFASTDNYEDIRKRLIPNCESMLELVQLPADKKVSIYVDRAIAAQWFYEAILKHPQLEIITWEKGFKASAQPLERIDGQLRLQRARNYAEDLQEYHLRYQRGPWKKNPQLIQWVVEATNPQNQTIIVSILATNQQAADEEVLKGMFSRWIQENDFKYLDKHFGINEITSYRTIHYNRLAQHLEDKQEKSGAAKALLKQKKQCTEELKRLLLAEHAHPGKSAPRGEKIRRLDQALKALQLQLEQIDTECSRLQRLIDEDYVRLDTSNKSLMDALKIFARNCFYKQFEPFKERYNNHRDDHDLFRNLTHSDGVLIERGCAVEAHLFPTVNYPPRVQAVVLEYLQTLNETPLLMPDGSGRSITFRLGKKSGFKLAIA